MNQKLNKNLYFNFAFLEFRKKMLPKPEIRLNKRVQPTS